MNWVRFFDLCMTGSATMVGMIVLNEFESLGGSIADIWLCWMWLCACASYSVLSILTGCRR